jgi:hypothetical protein
MSGKMYWQPENPLGMPPWWPWTAEAWPLGAFTAEQIELLRQIFADYGPSKAWKSEHPTADSLLRRAEQVYRDCATAASLELFFEHKRQESTCPQKP